LSTDRTVLHDKVDPAAELASLQIKARRGREVLAECRIFSRDLVSSPYAADRLVHDEQSRRRPTFNPTMSPVA
jgi:hypothetical protein